LPDQIEMAMADASRLPPLLDCLMSMTLIAGCAAS